MRKIYLDNAAAAPVDYEVQKEILQVMKLAGNPSSFNDSGRGVAEELKKARLVVARFLGAHAEEIVFTSSGSEANNLAIQGVAQAQGKKGNKIITSKIEHLSVLEPIRKLSTEGFKVVYLKNDEKGIIDLKDLEKNLRQDTLLVSVMYANNEIGTVEPIRKIGKVVKQSGGLFHVDACQAAGYLDMNVNTLGVDLLSFNGSKLGGPAGVGVLYIRKGTKIAPLILGGGQERGLRAGTENLPAIAGLAKAVSLVTKEEGQRLTSLRDSFINKLIKAISEAQINGAIGEHRLPNNINVSIPGTDSENLLLELDKYGISAGSGSACTARSVEPSHVLKAIGVSGKYLTGVIRFSLGKDTKKSDLDYVLKVIPKIVKDLKKRYNIGVPTSP